MKYSLLSKNRIHDGFIKLEMRTVEHEKFNGKMSGVLQREVVAKNAAVAAVVYHKEERAFILVKQFRAPLAGNENPWMRELVAGHIDGNEHAETAIKREIEEEIGYVVSEVDKLCSFYTSPGYSNEEIILFYCEVTEEMHASVGGGVESEDEDILVEKFSLATVIDMLNSDKICDAKTLIGLQMVVGTREL